MDCHDGLYGSVLLRSPCVGKAWSCQHSTESPCDSLWGSHHMSYINNCSCLSCVGHGRLRLWFSGRHCTGAETPCVVRKRPALRMALGSPCVVREASDLYGTETPCVVRGQRSVWHGDTMWGERPVVRMALRHHVLWERGQLSGLHWDHRIYVGSESCYVCWGDDLIVERERLSKGKLLTLRRSHGYLNVLWNIW